MMADAPWAYVDAGAGRNFITSKAVESHEIREILTVNGTKRPD